MKAEDHIRRKWLFFGFMAFVAFCINAYFIGPTSTESHQVPLHTGTLSPATPQVIPPQTKADRAEEERKRVEDQATATRKTAEEAAERHEQYLARYSDRGISRKAGKENLALVVVSEDGRFNRTLAGAISARLKSETVELFPHFFTPEFVSDGLFEKAIEDSGQLSKSLELQKCLDALVLARQRVQYSTDPSLENLVSAHMQLEITITPTRSIDDPRTWTLAVDGAGFTQKDARAKAEDRLLKKIADDPQMSLNSAITTNSTK